MNNAGCCFNFEQTRQRQLHAADHGGLNQLTRELNELSMKEREILIDDIHGVAQVQEETTELLRDSFQALWEELGKIPKRKKKALHLAMFLEPTDWIETNPFYY